MDVKTIPEDFKVTEIPNDRQIAESGDFKVYLLKKRNVETFFLLSIISKLNKIPIGKIGYAGLKDKYATTSQYISIPSQYSINTSIDYLENDSQNNSGNVKLELIGFTDSEIKRGDLNGNHFLITVRNIDSKDVEKIKNKAENISMGVPNYYDSQRFGSSSGSDFIGKYAIQQNFEEAVKLYLTGYSKFDPEKLAKLKEKILYQWPSLDNLNTNNKTFQVIIDEYNKTKDWQKSYLKISQNLREMFVFSYQSYLWNKAVEEVLKIYINSRSLYEIRYKVGRLTFYKGLSEKIYNKIPKQFHTISVDDLKNVFEDRIYTKILNKEGVRKNDFDIKQSTRTFLVSSNRNIILIPEKFRTKKVKKDELNENKMKMTFSFFLEKGSYATIVIKKLLGR